MITNLPERKKKPAPVRYPAGITGHLIGIGSGEVKGYFMTGNGSVMGLSEDEVHVVLRAWRWRR